MDDYHACFWTRTVFGGIGILTGPNKKCHQLEHKLGLMCSKRCLSLNESI